MNLDSRFFKKEIVQKFAEGATINSLQTKYSPASEVCNSLDTLVPASMANEQMRFNQQMSAYLLNKYKMNVDQYVAKKLHYESVDDLCFSDQLDELGNRKPKFAKEQIDAIATAIYSFEEKGDAIIVADQTGVGKGRIVAGLIKYAIQDRGVQPIFFTEKKHLINDIYRDLVDIGFCANVPIAKAEANDIRKDDWSDDEIIKIILTDAKEDEDLRIDYDLPEELEITDLKKYKKKLSESGDSKEDRKIKKSITIMEELIPLYRQHLLENGNIDTDYTDIDKTIYDEMLEKEIAKGKRVLKPFFPSRKNIVNKDGDILYKKLSEKEVKTALGYYKDKKDWIYDYDSKAEDLPELSKEYSLITLPYSQASALYEDIKKTGGKIVETPKFRFYKKIAKDTVIILDESHTAAGKDSNTGIVIRTLIEYSSMTTFVSATYAKTENNMPLYASKTSMREAGLTNEELIDVFSSGGVALQEAVSAELVRNGQLVRREKRIQGYSEYLKAKNELSDEVGTRQALKLNQIASVFKDVLKFQSKASSIVSGYKKSLPDRGIGQPIKGTKQEIEKARSVKALTFQMFNFFLLGIKVQQTSKVAVEKLNSGRKCVITIANTMESALNNMPKTFMTMKESDRYKIGDEIENDFKLYIAYLLFYSMRFVHVDEAIDDEGNSILNKKTVCVFDDSNHRLSEIMLSELSEEYSVLLKKILAMSTGISIAPIDEIKSRIKAATDYSIDEITGRNLCVAFKDNDYSKGTIQKRNIKDTTKLVKAFNDNEVDALFINQSGAVGISMHPVASGDVKIAYKTTKEKMFINDIETDVEVGFPTSLENKKEIKKRCMIVTQMELDINKEVQKLGRISRTGQVYEPEYIYIISSIPSEARISAMMEKKLRSLSANVSGNQEQSAYLFEADDFFGEIAIEPFNQTMKAMGNRTEIARKEEISDYTKLLYFDDFNAQEDFYKTFSTKLVAHIKEMERLGAYTGKVDKKDYKAEKISDNLFYIGDENCRTSFGRHGFIEKSSCVEFLPKNLEHDIKDNIASHLSITKKDENGVVNTVSFNSISQFKIAISERINIFKEEKNKITETLVRQAVEKIEANKKEITEVSKRIEDVGSLDKAIEKEKKLKSLNEKKEELSESIKEAASTGNFEKMADITKQLQSVVSEISEIDSEEKLQLNAHKRELLRLQKQQNELNEEIEDAYKSQTDYLNIIQLIYDYSTQIGQIGILSNYKEIFIEDASEEGDEQSYSSYRYEKISGLSVVITGVKFDALEYNDLNRSSISIFFTGVLGNHPHKVSELNPRVYEKDRKLYKNPVVKFEGIGQDYKGYWNEEIARKQDSSIKKEKWFVVGSTLINYPLVRRSGNAGNIIKYTEKDGTEKLGIEITDIEFKETKTSSYKILEQNYVKNEDHPIYFDGNKKNIENFITKYIANKAKENLRIYQTKEYPQSYDRYSDSSPKFYFQQSYQDKFIVYEFSLNKNENRFFSRMRDIVSYGFSIDKMKKAKGDGYDTDNYEERNIKYYEQELGGADMVMAKVEKLLAEDAYNFCVLNFDVKIFTTEAAVFSGTKNTNGIANILNDANIVQLNSSNFGCSGKSNFETSGYTMEADIRLKNKNESVFLTDSKVQGKPTDYEKFKNYIKLTFAEFWKFMEYCQENNAKPMFSTSKKVFESCKDAYVLEQFIDETKNTIDYVEDAANGNFREQIKNKIEKLVKLFT